MKRIVLALAALLALTAGAMTTANAVEFGVGPGGVYVGRDRHTTVTTVTSTTVAAEPSSSTGSTGSVRLWRFAAASVIDPVSDVLWPRCNFSASRPYFVPNSLPAAFERD